ncbi:MAG: hypothetical protein Q7J98_09405 [Kiritimatiellia bacterium]|nr:hypothetical protein [Kiritimatiellia bacterium]
MPGLSITNFLLVTSVHNVFLLDRMKLPAAICLAIALGRRRKQRGNPPLADQVLAELRRLAAAKWGANRRRPDSLAELGQALGGRDYGAVASPS